MIRIGFLDSWLEQAVDGSGTAVAIGGLAQTLRQRGYQVDRIVPTTHQPLPLTLRRLWYNWRLPQRTQHHPYDLLVGFDIDGVRLSGRTNVPFVCSVKGVIAEELQHEQGTIRRLLWSLARLERMNARRAPLVITTSRYCQRRIHAHYGVPLERIAIVPEGIQLTDWPWNPPEAREPATVLCVARQYRRKHIDDLLRAWPLVLQRVPEAELIIIGAGPEHDYLRSMALHHDLLGSVRMLGPLAADAEVRAWYQRSTVFCLPSVQEGFGIVFLEAMASGLPIVSTTITAIPEVVPQREAGILVEPRYPAAIAAALIELLQQPALRAAYAVAGRQHVAQYSWERVTDRFLAVIEQHFGAWMDHPVAVPKP